MTDKIDFNKEKKEKKVKKKGLILRFLSWLAEGTESDSKTSPFCST